jgi:hypothetical protein
MNVHIAKCLIVDHRQDYSRDRLPWLPARLYRLFREARPATH